jgi:hypothetical protein
MTDAAPATPLDSSAAPVTPPEPSASASPATPATPQTPAAANGATQQAAPIIGNEGPDDGGTPPVEGGDADWRKEWAGEDEKVLKRLSRYASPQGIVKALIAAQDKIQEKTNGGPLPEGATDAQKAEWRKANGIPDKADAYQLPKVDGYDWSDGDKEVATDFFASAHEANMSQAQAEKVFGWYAQRMAAIQADQFEKDTTARTTLEDDLRAEYGPEYRQNIKMLSRFAEKTPGIGADILAARLPDGRRLGEIPEYVKSLVEQARDHYGDSTFIAGDGGTMIANRKAEIEATMKTDINKYRSSGMAAEYRKILEAEERSKR